jgi:transcriptional regulator with XRE-family HTH domain
MLKDRIGEIIKMMTVAELAKKTGIGVRTLRTYLVGSEPSASKLAKIAEASGVDGNWLLTGKVPENSARESPGLQKIDEKLFQSIFDRIVNISDVFEPRYGKALLKSSLSHAIRVYNDIVHYPEREQLIRAELVINSDEIRSTQIILSNEREFEPRNPDEERFQKAQIDRYETILNELQNDQTRLEEELSIIKKTVPHDSSQN